MVWLKKVKGDKKNMQKKIFLSFLGLMLWGCLLMAQDQPEPSLPRTWIGIEVGSPFYNMILEEHDKDVLETYQFLNHQKMIEGIRKAEKELRLVTGEQFQVAIETGEVRRLLDLSPYLIRELRDGGLFFVDVTKDTVVVIPLDILKDLNQSLNPESLPSDTNLTTQEFLIQQFTNIAMDLRTATGLTTQRDGWGESGLSKVIISIFTLSPSGVANGTWDIGVGIEGAAEDTLFGVLKIARRGIKGALSWFIELFR